jgi:N-acetyl sugar amidotransferase
MVNAATNRSFQECTKCILDTNDYPEMHFDSNGVCEICNIYDDLAKRTLFKDGAGKAKLEQMIADIKEAGKGKEYDCIVGISGGVDSTYVAWLSKQWGLRPLVLHVDNGWNAELAVMNIENIVKKLGYDLYTYVLNWNQIKDLQLAFMKASVIDIDLPFDNAFMAVLYQLAAKHKIKYILSGHNTETEGYLPPNWVHNKLDTINIRDIHKHYGTESIKGFPMIGIIRMWYYKKIKKIEMATPLNFIDYNKDEVKKFIINELEWRDYGGKHYENIFTRFYQGYILVEKFGVNKRKSHLATLICSGQITKEQAIEENKKPVYDAELLKIDKDYFLKKFRLSEEEFNKMMAMPPKAHTDFKSYMNIYKKLRPAYRILKKLIGK